MNGAGEEEDLRLLPAVDLKLTKLVPTVTGIIVRLGVYARFVFLLIHLTFSRDFSVVSPPSCCSVSTKVQDFRSFTVFMHLIVEIWCLCVAI